MTQRFRLTMAQLDPVVGDLAGNARKAREAWEAGREAGADLVMLPEMFLTGYQTQDLVRKPAFALDAAAHLARLAEAVSDGPALGVGAPHAEGARLHNAYHVLADGQVRSRVLKHVLPNEDVFDEERLYEPGPLQGPFAVGNEIRIGCPICEDAWHPEVAETLAETGAEILVVPNGSPYYRGKHDVRLARMVARVVETGLPLVYLNMVGGQDDQVFDGGSFVLGPHGRLVAQFPVFEEHVGQVDFERTNEGWRALPGDVAPHPDAWEQDYRAMVEATRAYFRKSGFGKAVLGLSGGVDSALVAVIAADALGPEAVRCVMLPSEYTSEGSLADAAEVARRLGTRLDSVPIEGPRRAVTEALAPLMEGRPPGLAQENLQSRLRGLLLMALSNEFGGDAC